MYKRLSFLFLLTMLINACTPAPDADVIVYNAHVFTVNTAFDTVQAFAVKDGKFVALGSNEEIKKWSAKERVDANGQYVYPGLIDAHCHFTGYAMDSYKLDLMGTKSFDEILEKVNAYAKTNQREWIEGRGWDQNDWVDKNFPTKDKLDELFPDKPVFLLRVDGHAALCNQKALDVAKITCDFTIDGGENMLKNGSCTGVLIDNAIEEVRQYIPKLTTQDALVYFTKMQAECFANGLTTVVDCGVHDYVVDWLQKAYEDGLQIRTAVLLGDEKENFDRFLHHKPKQTEQFHVFGFKFYSDGALGSRGAYLLEDYHDRHDHRGFLLKSADSLKWAAEQLIQTDYQMCTHAIGDGAVQTMLKIYAEVLKGKNDRRWRIEHAQVVNENDVHYFGDYSIVPSVQPTHATSDMYWAGDRLGPERIKNAYAYATLRKQMGWIPLGTDFPVEYINPLFTFCSAVWREDAKAFPKGGFQIENALTREEALRGMTIWAAKSVFEEKQKGSIEKGKYADFIMTNVNLMQDDFLTIRNGKISQTFLGGKRVYSKK